MFSKVAGKGLGERCRLYGSRDETVSSTSFRNKEEGIRWI
jgi:hypothetical protein